MRVLCGRLVSSLLSLACIVGVAGGCAVDQSKEIATYRTLIDIPTTLPVEDFTASQPLTVRRAMLLANASNEQLSIEGENYLQSLIDRRRAVAAFLPTVSLGPRYTFRDRSSGGGGGGDNINDIGNGGTGSSQRETFDVPVEGTVNVFNGFSDLARLRSSRLTIAQRRALLLDFQEQLLLDVARVFYQVLRSEESVRVLENSLEVQDARLRDVRGRQEAGVVRPLDVAQIEAQASQTRVSLIAARNDVVNGRATLAFITNAPVADSPLIEAFEVPPTIASREALEAAAARRRDLEAAVAATRAAREEVEVAWGQYYPSVALDLNVFLYRESSPESRDWDALIRANLPIFSAGLIHADVRTAWSLFRQAVLVESLTRRQVAQDVAIAYQDLLSSGRRLEESRTQLAAAEQAFVQADRSNAIGLATNLERLIAQDQLLTAQLQYVSEQFARTVSYLNLLRATGSLRSALEEMAATRPTTKEAVSDQLSAISQRRLE